MGRAVAGTALAALLLLDLPGGASAAPASPPVQEGWAVVFDEEFDGRSIDRGRWDDSIATSGLRTFPGGPNQSEADWRDPASVQPPPYGSLEVRDGVASFSAGRSRPFPFLFASSPGRRSPFPDEGDFVFEVRMRWDRVGRQGPWILLSTLDSFVPGRPTDGGVMEGKTVLGMMSCSGRGTRVYGPGFPLGDHQGERGIDLRPFCDVTGFHDYRLACVDGRYTLTVDGRTVFGPIWSPLRPRNILLGSWAVPTWEVADWSCFTIDRIRVLAAAPDPFDDLPPGLILTRR